jgi:excisionase family DNA binding protein
MKRLSGTLKQATEASGLSTRKLYDLIASGNLESTTVGRRRLIIWESLEKLLLRRDKREAANAR